jgi:hypothetical protein
MVVITDVTSVTGSYLAKELLAAGENVRGINSAESGMERLEHKGLNGINGDLTNPDFMTECLQGVETVFYMIPLHANKDGCREFFIETATVMAKALHDSKVQRLFFLSTMGADENRSSGLLSFYRDVEKVLNGLYLEEVIIIRPGYFMDHLLTKIPMIRMDGIIGDVIDPDTPLYFTDRRDTAARIASLYLDKQYYGRSKIEMYNDKMSLRQAAEIIADKLEIPQLHYVRFTDSEYRNYLVTKGASESFAHIYLETAHAIGMGAITPSLIDLNVPNLPKHFSEYIDTVFIPAFTSGEE